MVSLSKCCLHVSKRRGELALRGIKQMSFLHEVRGSECADEDKPAVASLTGGNEVGFEIRQAGCWFLALKQASKL